MKQKHDIEKLVRNYQPPSDKTKEQAWKELNARMQANTSKRIISNRIFTAAAVITALLVLSILADSLLFVEKYTTEEFVQQTVILPDESEVLLNPNSEMKVNYSFITGKRQLKLNGEALFDVKMGESFIVDFGTGKVTVLGTRFRIKSYNNFEPEINCLSGSVRINVEGIEKTLRQGDGVVFNNNTVLEPENSSEDKIMDEIDGIYIMENQPLSKVFQSLEVWSGYEVQATENSPARRFSGELNLRDVQNTCETVAFAMNLNYSIDHLQKVIRFDSQD